MLSVEDDGLRAITRFESSDNSRRNLRKFGVGWVKRGLGLVTCMYHPTNSSKMIHLRIYSILEF